MLLKTGSKNLPIKLIRHRASRATELSGPQTSPASRVTSLAGLAGGVVVLRAETLHAEAPVQHEARGAGGALERPRVRALAAVVVAVPAPVQGRVEAWGERYC